MGALPVRNSCFCSKLALKANDLLAKLTDDWAWRQTRGVIILQSAIGIETIQGLLVSARNI
jgi:hypothetical protein